MSGDNENGGFKLLQAYRGLPKSKALIKFLSEEGVKQTLLKTENFYMQDNNPFESIKNGYSKMGLLNYI